MLAIVSRFLAVLLSTPTHGHYLKKSLRLYFFVRVCVCASNLLGCLPPPFLLIIFTTKKKQPEILQFLFPVYRQSPLHFINRLISQYFWKYPIFHCVIALAMHNKNDDNRGGLCACVRLTPKAWLYNGVTKISFLTALNLYEAKEGIILGQNIFSKEEDRGYRHGPEASPLGWGDMVTQVTEIGTNSQTNKVLHSSSLLSIVPDAK
ncbi:hypothetical protein TSMEX_007435 [Taenia solium]|eukprot:TsM_000425100 transcript=TsM_000425100 gene=TsM_000425100